MAKSLAEWIEDDVQAVKDKPVSWLSTYHFFRDPPRPAYSDLSYFFAPADGVILYQDIVAPGESMVTIKGRPYSLQEAMADPAHDKPSLVVGIFMTFYDVHVNRIPYPGLLSYRLLDPIDTYNHPMIDVEHAILEKLDVGSIEATYLHHNQRMINRIRSSQLGQEYYVLQVADYDVDCVTPFNLRQNQPALQGERFSQIRFGSQVDLVIPLSPRYEFEPTQSVGDHVEAGIDHVVAIRGKAAPQGRHAEDQG